MTALTWTNKSSTTALTQGTGTPALQLQVLNTDGGSFNVNSTLIYGEKDALVIDAGFTRADALRIAGNILDSGKKLVGVLVSQADPDYYFGVETLREFFPNVPVWSTAAVLEKLTAKVQAKLAFWVPKMGANAPKTPVVPQLLSFPMTLEGHTIEVKGDTGLLAHRPYFWIPSIRAIVGNIGVFGNLHVWTADTQTTAERTYWINQLDEMAALKPQIVVPGHMASGTVLDVSAVEFTKGYLQSFEQAVAKSANSDELMTAMKTSYPKSPVGLALQIGAKVNKGEMKW